MDNSETLSRITAFTATWPTLPDGARYNYLKAYLPINAYAGASLTEEEEADRKLISDFGCKLLTTPEEHEEAVKTAVGLVAAFLKETFGEDVSRLTLVPIPASSDETTVSRYRSFCRELSFKTGIGNGYGLIYRAQESNDIEASASGFAYKHEIVEKAPYCLLFDDLISTGKTMSDIAREVSSLGCEVVGCLALGKVANIDDNQKR